MLCHWWDETTQSSWARVGLHERVDIGARINNLSSLGADIKYNFYRSVPIDWAVAPGGQWLRSPFNVYHI
jgi:hypothetical protein